VLGIIGGIVVPVVRIPKTFSKTGTNLELLDKSSP
jgi:hypothetical protein